MPTFTIGSGKDYPNLQTAMAAELNTPNSIYEIHDAGSLHNLSVNVNLGFEITSLFQNDIENYPLIDHTANTYFNAHNTNVVKYSYFRMTSSNNTTFHSGQDVGGDVSFTNIIFEDYSAPIMDMNGGSAAHVVRYEDCIFRDSVSPIFTVGSLWNGGFTWALVNNTFDLITPNSDDVVGNFTSPEDAQLSTVNWTITNNLFNGSTGFASLTNSPLTVTHSLIRNSDSASHTGIGNVNDNDPDFAGGAEPFDLRINVGSPAEGIGQNSFGNPPDVDISGLQWSVGMSGTDAGAFSSGIPPNIIINHIANPEVVFSSTTDTSVNHAVIHAADPEIVFESDASTSIVKVGIIEHTANPEIVFESDSNTEVIFPRITDHTANPTVVFISFAGTEQTSISGIVKIPDHAQQALNRLIEQYKKKPRIENLVIDLIGDPVQDLEDAFFTLYQRLDINFQVNGQLDLIGTIVGESRNGLSDAEYRVALKGRIAVNNSKGTIEDVIQLWKLFSNATQVQVQELFPAEIRIFTDAIVGIGLNDLAISFVKEIIGAGIKYGGTVIGSSSNAFSFASTPDNPNTGGFGDSFDSSVGGLFSTLLIGS